MANNNEDDIDSLLAELDDIDDIDFEDSFDEDTGNDVEFDEDKDGKGRKPVLKTAKKIGGNAAQTIKSKKLIDHASLAFESFLSTDTRSSANNIKSMTESVRDEFVKGLSPIKEELGELLGNIEKHVPKEGTIRKIFDFAKEKTKKEDYSSFASSYDELSAMLETIDHKLEATKEKEEAEIAFKQSDIDFKKISATSLSSINASIKIGNEYNKIFGKKSLELQYKTYLILQEALATAKSQHTEVIKQNEAIIKNTGLPEYVKIKMSERLGASVKSGIASMVTDTLFQGDSPIKLMAENIKSNASAKMNSFLSKIAQGNMLAGTMNAAGGKINKTAVIGGIVGDTLLKSMYWLGGKGLGKDKVKGVENAIQSFAADPESFLKDKLSNEPKGLIGKTKDKFLRMALDLATTHNKFKEVKLDTVGLKDQAIFDGETHRSINMVIPKLLAKIHNEVQGLRTGTFSKDNELRFDHDKLNFITTKETKEKIERNIETEIFEKTIKSVDNITSVVKERMKGVNFYGKELIMGHLGNAILAYITENGRISPADLTKKDFIQYFDPSIQPKIAASMSVFQDIIKNDDEKSTVYRTFSTSLSAIKTSPAVLNKYSSGMNADILLDDEYYTTDIYAGSVNANGAGLAKKMFNRSGVKKHKTKIKSPSSWGDNSIDFFNLKDEIKDDISNFKNRKKKQNFLNLEEDSYGNVKHSQDGIDFIINKSYYARKDIEEEIGFKIKYDYDLIEAIKEYKDPKTDKERKTELAETIQDILKNYDNERLNKIYGNKFIRAGKKFIRKEKHKELWLDWFNRIDAGEDLDSIFSSEMRSNTEILKQYDMYQSAEKFKEASGGSKVFTNYRTVKAPKKEIKPVKPAPVVKPVAVKKKTKRTRQSKSSAGELPNSSIKNVNVKNVSDGENKIKSDLEKAVKVKKNQVIINAISTNNLEGYYNVKDINKIEDAIEASDKDVNNFLMKKYNVTISDLDDVSSGKVLYMLDKTKSIKPIEEVSNTSDIRNDLSLVKDVVSDNETRDIQSSTNKKMKELKKNVVETTNNLSDQVHVQLQSLKFKLGSDLITNVEKGIKTRLDKEKKKSKDKEDFIDKVFNFREKITEFLNPKNLLYNASKFIFGLPRNYVKFFKSDFAKNMRAKERNFLGKMIKGVAKSPLTIAKGLGIGLGAVGKGAWHGLTGYKEFATSDVAKAARKKERAGISKLAGLPLTAGAGIISKLGSKLFGSSEDPVGKDRKNGWRQRLAALDEEKKKKEGKTAEHKKADPKNSWLMKLLKPLAMIIPLALTKIMGWGKTLFKPLVKIAGKIVPGLLKGIGWLGKGIGKALWSSIGWLGKAILGMGAGGFGLPSLGKGGKGIKMPKLKTVGKVGAVAALAGGLYWGYNKMFGDDKKSESKDTSSENSPYMGNGDFDLSSLYEDSKLKESKPRSVDISKDLKALEDKHALVKTGKDKVVTETYKEKVKVKNKNYISKEEAEKKVKNIQEQYKEEDLEDGKNKRDKITARYPWFNWLFYGMNGDFYGSELAFSIMNETEIKDDSDVAYVVKKYLSMMLQHNPNFINTPTYKVIKDGYDSLPAKAREASTKDFLKMTEARQKELERRRKEIEKVKKASEESEYITEEIVKTREVKKSSEDGIKLRPDLYEKLVNTMYAAREMKEDLVFYAKNKKVRTIKGTPDLIKKSIRNELLSKGPFTVKDLEDNIQKQTKLIEELKKKLDSLVKEESDYQTKEAQKRKEQSKNKQPNNLTDPFVAPEAQEGGGLLSTVGSYALDAAMWFPGTAFKLGKNLFSKGKDLVTSAVNSFRGKPSVPTAPSVPTTSPAPTKPVTPTTPKSGGFFSNMWNKAKDIGSKVVNKVKDVGGKVIDKAKNVGSTIASKAKDVGTKASKETKNIAKKILGILKNFKTLAVKKLGKNAAVKLIARIAAKIAARAVPLLGWGLLLVDAAEVALKMLKNKLGLVAAISVVLLGFDITDKDSVAVDEDGNPIQPDDSDPDPKKTQKEYAKEKIKVEKEETKKAEEAVKEAKKIDPNIDGSKEEKKETKKASDIVSSRLSERNERFKKYENNLNKGNNQIARTTSGGAIENTEDESSYGEFASDIDLKKDPSKSQLNNVEYIKSLFTFDHYDRSKFKRYNKVTPEEAFLRLNTDFKERLVGLARDYMSLTGKKLQVNSSFRTKAYQGALSGKGPKASPGNSPHQYGIAADIQMGEKPGDTAGMMKDLGVAKGTELLNKWGLWRPLWGANYKGKSPEDWHLEPIWTKSVAKNNDGFTSTLRFVGKNGIRQRYNVKDENATKAVEDLRQGNLRKFGGTDNDAPKLDNSVAGGDTQIASVSSTPSVETTSNIDNMVESNNSLNVKPLVVPKRDTGKFTQSNNSQLMAKNGVGREVSNEESSDTNDKVLNVNEQQLAVQRENLELTKKLIKMLESQHTEFKEQEKRDKIEESRIQNAKKNIDPVISNSPEENAKTPQNITPTTNRPGLAFNLSRR